MSALTASDIDVVYPESDGKPMADNTVQWDWMVMIVGELRAQFSGQEVFVAGDLLWYPVEGEPKINAAPDAMVAFGRPAGDRSSYVQWKEAGVAPQVVFEVLSPSNTESEFDDKLEFYERHGVEEYYVVDPYDHHAEGYIRRGRRLAPVRKIFDHISPRLGIRFEKSDGELRIVGTDGRVFQSREEREEGLLGELGEERQRTLVERRNKDKLAAKLRELGIDPDAV